MSPAYREGVVDPYDPTTANPTPETPSMDRVMAEAVRQGALSLRVALPASVVAVRGNQLVDVQPLLMARYAGKDASALPIIPHALVCAPMGAAWGLKVPLAVGDTGLAIFCDRSLDAWASGDGSLTDPADCRAHDLCDAVFLPGLVPVSGQTTDQTGDLVLTNGKASLRATAGGQFALSNGSVELVALTAQLADALGQLCNVLATQAFTMTALGPMPFLASTLVALQAQQQKAQGLLAQVNQLKRSGP